MKTCSKCKKEKELHLFRKDKTQKDGRYPQCTECKKESYRSTERKAYESNRLLYGKNRRERAIQLLTEIKLESGCYVCNENGCAATLDFHHKDPSQKDFVIGDNRCLNTDRLKEEVSKCVVLCSNCHRKVHNDYICLVL